MSITGWARPRCQTRKSFGSAWPPGSYLTARYRPSGLNRRNPAGSPGPGRRRTSRWSATRRTLMLPRSSSVPPRSVPGRRRRRSPRMRRGRLPSREDAKVGQGHAGDGLVAQVRPGADCGGLGDGVEPGEPPPRAAAPSQGLGLREVRIAQGRPHRLAVPLESPGRRQSPGRDHDQEQGDQRRPGSPRRGCGGATARAARRGPPAGPGSARRPRKRRRSSASSSAAA